MAGMNNVKSSRADHWSNPMAHAGQMIPRFLNARVEPPWRWTEASLWEPEQFSDELFATLVHELRNPVMAIRCALEVVGKRYGDSLTLEATHGILKRKFGQLSRFLDEMLEVSTTVYRDVVEHTQHVELGDVLVSAIDTVKPLVDLQRHEVHLMLPAAPLHLRADPTCLSQTVTSLLTCVATHTPAGGRIRLTAHVCPESDQVKVHRVSRGRGIAATELGRVLDMFTRVAYVSGLQLDDFGISLALSLQLSVRHGGSVTAQSDGTDNSSDFILSLPIAATYNSRPELVHVRLCCDRQKFVNA